MKRRLVSCRLFTQNSSYYWGKIDFKTAYLPHLNTNIAGRSKRSSAIKSRPASSQTSAFRNVCNRWSTPMYIINISQQPDDPREVAVAFNSCFTYTLITNIATNLPALFTLADSTLVHLIQHRKMENALAVIKPFNQSGSDGVLLLFSTSSNPILRFFCQACLPPPCQLGYFPSGGKYPPLFR